MVFRVPHFKIKVVLEKRVVVLRLELARLAGECQELRREMSLLSQQVRGHLGKGKSELKVSETQDIHPLNVRVSREA